MSSLPTRGAWIEINTANPRNAHCCRRSPPGERGLKYARNPPRKLKEGRRSPPGEHGLKFLPSHLVTVTSTVAPHPGSVD